MADSARETTQHKRPRQPLITNSSILILSSFVIGTAVQRTLPDKQVLLVLAAGVVGMLSFLGLDYVARCRAERREIEAEEEGTELLEGRLNKHVPPSMQGGGSAKARMDWQTLVAVAEEGRE